MQTCAKTYTDFPAAHRAPKHDGHCALVHGHNWSFHFEFEASQFDPNGFVVDFGKLEFIRDFLKEQFDHTCLIADSDPEVDRFIDLSEAELIELRLVEDCSCEGIARMVGRWVDQRVTVETGGRVKLKSVTVHEDSKNSATYSL